MKIIITGEAGFIGSSFVRRMVSRYPDCGIINLDLLTYAGNLENLKPVGDEPDYKSIKGDVTDRKFIFELFEKEKPDVVINFAVESYVGRSITGPRAFVKTNVMGITTLLDACRIYGIKHYHQVSTGKVYGDLLFDRSDFFFTRETPLHTFSPYSSSKASADLFVLVYHRAHGLPVTTSRCSSSYGPHYSPERLIFLITSRALADGGLPVYGTGESMRGWLCVADHCQAIGLTIHKGCEGEMYNIEEHSERTNLEVVKTTLEALDKPESLVKFVADRPGYDMRYVIDPAKIETELGWKPAYNFGIGIEQTIRWYLDNQD